MTVKAGPPWRCVRALHAVAIVAAWAAACASAHDPAATHVRIAIGGQTQMVYLPTTLAEALGFYEFEKLDVELQDFEGGSKALQALIGGSADVVSGYYDHTIQMRAEGRDLVAFVTMLRYPGLALVTSPQAAGTVTGIPALEGGVAGVTAVGSSTHMFLTLLLMRHRVPVDSVSVTSIGAGATAIAAIERGRVQAGWLADPSFTLVKKRNPGVRVLVDLREERGTAEAFGTPSYPGAVLYTRAEWLDANRETAAKLARAIVKTLEWMRVHSEDEIAARMPPGLRGDDTALYVEALKNSRAIFSTDGIMPADGARAVHEVLSVSMPKVRGVTDLSRTYTNEFVTGR
jgi:NitT/TauT family transport system substrate-binding protein